MIEPLPSPAKRADHRRGIIAFLAIAFGLAWIGFIPALFGKEPVPALMPISPAIAAFVVRKWVTREGFADSGWHPRLRHWRLYLIAVAWPIGATFVSVAIAVLVGVTPDNFAFPWGVDGPGLLTLLTWIAVSVAIAPIIFGEEFGWRGYLQVRLFAENPWKAAIATGLIWGVWHYPLILVDGENTANKFVMLGLFPIATTNLTIFLGWLRMRTADVWSTSVGHASNNITEDSWHRTAFTGKSDGVPSSSADLIAVIAEAIVLIGVVLLDRVVLNRPRGARSLRMQVLSTPE
jgi:membrane protease YdiL (CAAX protease family)